MVLTITPRFLLREIDDLVAVTAVILARKLGIIAALRDFPLLAAYAYVLIWQGRFDVEIVWVWLSPPTTAS